tara:strand:- start:3753 stop:3983 length:231 start_codon:yes stop_codon:yes gene_type:complete
MHQRRAFFDFRVIALKISVRECSPMSDGQAGWGDMPSMTCRPPSPDALPPVPGVEAPAAGWFGASRGMVELFHTAI